MTENDQWEYRVESFGSIWRRAKEEDIAAALNEWGEDGWEVVSTSPIANTYGILVVAKRPLSRSVRRERTWGT